MYHKCYMGHIPWTQWLCLAEYCVNYVEEKTKELDEQLTEANHAAWQADKNWKTYAD